MGDMWITQKKIFLFHNLFKKHDCLMKNNVWYRTYVEVKCMLDVSKGTVRNNWKQSHGHIDWCV